jgi:hypothetical protein
MVPRLRLCKKSFISAPKEAIMSFSLKMETSIKPKSKVL